MNDNFSTKFKKLSLSNKVVMFASFLMVASVFFPWFSDLDRFNTGNTFIGLTGPAYLAGYLVLLGGLASLTITVMHLLQKRVPKLPLSEQHFHIFTGAMAIFMTLMASSVYFHAQFGFNIAEKTMRTGMILSFVGAVANIAGALLIAKPRMSSEQVEEHENAIDEIIDLDTKDRIQGTLENNEETMQNGRPELYTERNESHDMVEEAITVGDAMRRAQQERNTNDIQ